MKGTNKILPTSLPPRPTSSSSIALAPLTTYYRRPKFASLDKAVEHELKHDRCRFVANMNIKKFRRSAPGSPTKSVCIESQLLLSMDDVVDDRSTFPLAPEPDGNIIIWSEPLPWLENIPDINFRNGDLSDVTPILWSLAIPTAFHWVPVNGLVPEDSTLALDAYIKSALYQLTTHKPTSWTSMQLRKAAIALGTARATMTSFYKVTNSDIISQELASPVINVTKQQDGTLTHNIIALENDENTNILTNNLNLDESENAAIAILMTCTLGVLPVQGFSLMMTGEHYISEGNNESRKAFAAIERQFWNRSGVAEWFNRDIEMLQDVCWHKSGHPVNTYNLKLDLAMSEKVKLMLVEAGVGSAAIRLPAMEPPLRAVVRCIKLMSTVDPFLRMFGGSMDMGLLPDAVTAIKAWPRVGKPENIPMLFPENVKSRAQAINWLSDFLKRNRNHVAYCYGFYCSLTREDFTMIGAETSATLKGCYSLSKLRTECVTSYVEGTLGYQDFAAAMQKKRRQLGN